jgi:hypothetical protein
MASAEQATPQFNFSWMDVPREEWLAFFQETSNTPIPPWFRIERIRTIINPFRYALWQTKRQSFEQEANVRTLFHSPNDFGLDNILNTGLDVKHSRIGFFGKGIYFCDNPINCNKFNRKRGTPSVERTMLVCSVILGNQNVFPHNEFQRELVSAPAEYHSVIGNIRRFPEYVVYQNCQVLITHVITYTIPDVSFERTIVQINLCVDALVSPIVLDFFGKLRRRMPDRNLQLKWLFLRYLKRVITIEHFVHELEQMVSGSAPPTIADRLRDELPKCNAAAINLDTPDYNMILSTTIPKVQAPALAPAPAPALALAQFAPIQSAPVQPVAAAPTQAPVPVRVPTPHPMLPQQTTTVQRTVELSLRETQDAMENTSRGRALVERMDWAAIAAKRNAECAAERRAINERKEAERQAEVEAKRAAREAERKAIKEQKDATRKAEVEARRVAKEAKRQAKVQVPRSTLKRPLTNDNEEDVDTVDDVVFVGYSKRPVKRAVPDIIVLEDEVVIPRPAKRIVPEEDVVVIVSPAKRAATVTDDELVVAHTLAMMDVFRF